jgi:hypothetical protein
MPLGARMLATLYILKSNENQGVKQKWRSLFLI